jgi:hypothetical protein
VTLYSGGGERDVWINSVDHWLVVFEGAPGWTLTYYRYTPLADSLRTTSPRGLLAVARSMLGKTRASIPGGNQYGDVFLDPAEYSLHPVELSPDFDDHGRVESVNVILDVPTDKRADVNREIQTAWGAKPAVKRSDDSSDDDAFSLTALGATDLEMVQEPDADNFHLRKKK